MKINTNNGHDLNVVNEFNQCVEKIDNYGLLEFILTRWASDQDLKSIIEEIKENNF
jgi:hypothetical protein